MASLNKEFGFKDKPINQTINTHKQKSYEKPMSRDEMTKLENSFMKTGKFVENEDMLDGFQRLTLFKIGLPTL
jgi:hypothetical protein